MREYLCTKFKFPGLLGKTQTQARRCRCGAQAKGQARRRCGGGGPLFPDPGNHVVDH